MIKGRGVPFVLLLMVLVLRPHLAGNAYPFAQGLFLVPLLVGFGVLLLASREESTFSPGILTVVLIPWIIAGWALVSLFWTPDAGQGLRDVVTFLGNAAVFSLAAFLIREEGGDRDGPFGRQPETITILR